MLALAVAGLFGPTLTAESWTPWLRSAATAAVLVVLAVVVQLARAKCAAVGKAP